MTGELPLLGFGLPVAGSWATPETMRRTARRAEELGYASLWTFQRVLHPVDGGFDPAHRTGLDPAHRAGLDPAHRTVHDPVVALAYVAGHTDRIGLGTATICAPFTAPALLAKTMTSLDVLSGGRLTVGLGIGWLPQEYAAAGVPFARRGARMDEYLRCLEALWTQDPVEEGDRSRLLVHVVEGHPREYLVERRLHRARPHLPPPPPAITALAPQLLTDSDTSITAIAHATGFRSGQHLATAFRRGTGHTPSHHRRRTRHPT